MVAGGDDVSALAPVRFGQFVLDEAAFELRRAGQPVALEPRVLRLLLHLARNRQRAVSRAELVAILWPSHVVSAASLNEAVNLARRAVGDVDGAQAVVATLRGHGYRFVAPVDEPGARGEAGAAAGEPPHFVGRLRELDSLRAIAGDVGRGAARIVLVEGEAGIGKTTLVRRFAESAAAAGYAVVGGRNDSDCGAPSYWMWIQVLRALLLRPEMAAVRRRAPHSLAIVKRLAGSEAMAEQAVVAAHDRRLWLFDDVAGVLRLFAEACPLLIVLDDLQAASEDSLLLLRFLARHLDGTRTMIIGTFRRASLADDDALTATLTELRRVPCFTEMTIGGLSQDDTTALIGRRAAPPLVRELQRRTGGNPLFLKEIAAPRDEPVRARVVRSRRCRGGAATRPGASRASATWWRNGSGDSTRIRGRSSTRRRFSASGSRRRTSPIWSAGRAAAIDGDMESLHAQGFFQAAPQLTGVRQFTHPIVREAALALLAPRRSQQLHDRAVKRLERAGADERARHLPQLAYHAFAALPLGSTGKAVRHGQAAAAQAASQLRVRGRRRSVSADVGRGGAGPRAARRSSAPSCSSPWARSGHARPTRGRRARPPSMAFDSRAAGGARICARAPRARSVQRSCPYSPAPSTSSASSCWKRRCA